MVAILGSRQVGKTTLALELSTEKPTHYLDLERPSDLSKLSDPELYLSKHAEKLIILDEIQRMPELFPLLRSLVDERRRAGEKNAQFLILGSASKELLQQSSETLAGRISYLELSPFNLKELPNDRTGLDHHWYRGGYPESYLATNDSVSTQWCEDFVMSCVERTLPQMGVSATPIQLNRLLRMLAHHQGSPFNATTLANSLGLDPKTIRTYVDLFEGLFLLRRLPAWSRNAGKRLVKAPKIYLRDTGLLHYLAGLPDLESVLGHPICGHSWEGYCLEQIIQKLPKHTRYSYYRTHAGAEIDLILESSKGEISAIEIKRTLSPKLTPVFRESMQTVAATRGFYVIPDGDRFPLSSNVESCGLYDFLGEIEA